MIIAVNKCPQNITLKAFNLSPQIYILSLFQYSRKWMGMEMGLYVPITTEEPTAASGAIRKRPRTTSSTDDITPTNSEWAKKITTLSKRFTKFTITNGRLQLRSDQPTTKTKTAATQTTLS